MREGDLYECIDPQAGAYGQICKITHCDPVGVVAEYIESGDELHLRLKKFLPRHKALKKPIKQAPTGGKCRTCSHNGFCHMQEDARELMHDEDVEKEYGCSAHMRACK